MGNLPFITYRETDEGGELQYYVAQKAHPHYVGQVIDNPNFASLYKVPIPNTTMYIAYFGVIEGRRFPLHSHFEQEINGTLVAMAEWYYHNRIKKDEKKYKKWLLLNQVQPASY